MAAQVEIQVNAQDNFSGVLGNFGSILTGIESAINLVGDAFRVFTDLAGQGLTAVASYERLEMTFQSLAASQLLMSDGAKDMNEALALTNGIGAELLDWSQQLAIHSPFTQEGVAEAFKMAMAYGFNVDESKRLTQAMLDFSAATGNTEFAMERIARALGQISAAGKLTAQDINQLVAVGVPVNQILAEHFETTTQGIMDMREKGLIPAEEAIEAITVWMETNFAGAADRMTTTWAGLIGTLTDLKQMGLREYFTGVLDALQPLVVQFTEWFQVVGMEKLGEWGKALAEFVKPYAELGQAVLTLSSAGADPLTALIKALEASDNPKIQGFVDTLLKVVSTIQTFISTGQSEGWDVAIGNLLSGIWDGLDIPTKIQELVNTLSVGITNADWTKITATLGDILTGAVRIAIESTIAVMDVIVNDVDWTPLGVALKGALKEVWAGLFADGEDGISIWDNIKIGILGAVLSNPLVSIPIQIGYNLGNLVRIGIDIVGGIIEGAQTGMANLYAAFRLSIELLIMQVKAKLGILSPSTVFKDIGKNLVQGLIDGWKTSIDGFIDLIKGSIAGIIDLFPDWLQNAIGLGGASASGLGTAGGGTAGSGTSGSTGTVVYNIYGPAYFGTLSPDANGYDCPSPSPLVASSGNQLVVTGF